jgi:hypothetical protein
MLTHGVYPPEELEKVREAFAQGAAAGDEDVPARASATRAELAAAANTPAWATEIASVRADVEDLKNRLEALTAEIRELKTALGV